METKDDFTGRVALVTGGADGMGWAAAERFARRGARVSICDVDVETGAARVEWLRSIGTEAVLIPTDVGDPDQCEAAVRRTVEAFGRLDVAFNNAGFPGELRPLAEQTTSDWDRVIAVTLSGVFHCMRHEIHEMLRHGQGCIVNNSSAAGLVGFPTIAPYSAAKHGIVGLTQTAALEYARQGIRINAVCPGYMDTAMTRRSASAEMQHALAQSTPIGRLGRPEEVAELAVWLCSAAASYVNGAIIPVDGGVIAG